LGGTLQVSLVNGFTPQSGNTFQIMTYASDTGTFSTVINWNPPDTVLYDNLDVTLQVFAVALPAVRSRQSVMQGRSDEGRLTHLRV
jgi:hypothetical protein